MLNVLILCDILPHINLYYNIRLTLVRVKIDISLCQVFASTSPVFPYVNRKIAQIVVIIVIEKPQVIFNPVTQYVQFSTRLVYVFHADVALPPLY